MKKAILLFLILNFCVKNHAQSLDSSQITNPDFIQKIFKGSGSFGFELHPIFHDDLARMSDKLLISSLRNSEIDADVASILSDVKFYEGAAFMIHAGRKKKPASKKDDFTETSFSIGYAFYKEFESYDYLFKQFKDSAEIIQIRSKGTYEQLILGFRKTYWGKEKLRFRLFLGINLWTGIPIYSHIQTSQDKTIYASTIRNEVKEDVFRLKPALSSNISFPLGASLRIVENLSFLSTVEAGFGYMHIIGAGSTAVHFRAFNIGMRYDW